MSETSNPTAIIDAEIARVSALTRAMIAEYETWGDKITYNDGNSLYMDLLSFVNLRLETAESCLLLIENKKVADSLGLSRSLLENYLLLMLMCRGTKYIQLQDRTSLTEGRFKAELREKQDELQQRKEQGETQVHSVKKYPGTKRYLMYVIEDHRDESDPSLVTPLHFFLFSGFRPEVMRLKDEDYFQYYEHDDSTKKAIKGQQVEAAMQYRFYLSYDALLQNLVVNDLADTASITRIEAHYTFLGKFLHPTHNAARELHDRNDHDGGATEVGVSQPYSRIAVLLAELYVCYLVAGLLTEVAALIESAPAKYVKEAGTASLREAVDRIPAELSYFWFLFNDPPLYDKFNWCVNHATDKELAKWGGYSGAPNGRIPFTQHVYSQLQQALGGGSNARCGEYVSPLARRGHIQGEGQ